MTDFRDVELLSAYLDGQLKPSDAARLELRLKTDLQLASIHNELQLARNVLRKLPARKAPRTFVLTRKMVGAKPPMPRAYSFFRFSTAFATLLLVITFTVNLLGTRISLGAAAPAPAQEFGYGGGPGIGGGCEEPCDIEPELQVPSAATEAPAASDAPLMELQGIPTQTISASEESARVLETPASQSIMPKEGESDRAVQNQPQGPDLQEPVDFLSGIQMGLLILGGLSAVIAFLIRRSARRKWS